MSLGELILAIIIITVFCLGIWGGIRLFRWNMRDRAELAKRNEERMKRNEG
jgi:hypothetical protein